MMRCCAIGLSVLVSNLALGLIIDDERILKRGDVNNDNYVDGSDPIFLSSYLYQGGPAPPCLNQADANNDGYVDGSDSIYLFQWLYNGGPAPPSPGPYNQTCTTDNSPYPGCQNPCR